MDIAVIGPEKFAFQDMACIELALSYCALSPFKLVPEPIGGEDASLKWAGISSPILEVQVKGAEGTAGISKLADYLTHYPPRCAEGALLQRLMEGDERYALFILTARCTDELTSLLLARPLIGKPSAKSVSNALSKALQDEIAKSAARKPRNATKLKLARLSNMATLAERPIADFERALTKTSLIEQQTAETIEVRLHDALRAKRFDTLSIRGLIARCSDLLAESKRRQSDAVAPILKEVSASSPSALCPNNYHERGIENDLEGMLCRDRYLLLAGPPRAGKSWTARALAGRLQLEGYEVRQGSFVEEAERFITDPVGAERVYVLDDPIGSREPCSDANAQLGKLAAMCERIPTNHRLIVAQSEQVLLQTTAKPDLTACKLGGKDWLRLEPLPIKVAENIWLSVASIQSVPNSAISRVVELIANEPGLREPGALNYLSQTWSELADDPLDEEIILQARKDASDFSRGLAMQGAGLRDLLTASALATTESAGAASEELAFIINGTQGCPSIAPNIPAITVFEDDSCRPPPTYASEQLLNQEQQQGLDLLQRRRVIEEQDSRFNFTHPYLRAGAQTLVSPDIPSDLQRVLPQLERAIACCSPMTSLAAARNLRWMRSVLQQSWGDEVFEIASQGVHSKFPATRDCCFEFLIEFADLLPSKLSCELPYLSEQMVIELESVDVSHGIGFISNKINWFDTTSPLREVQPYLEAIEKGSALGLDLSLSYRILTTLKGHAEALSAAATRRFLRADEAVVRASTARLWIQLPRANDEDILARLKLDATPAMSTALLIELAHSWEKLSEPRREKILTVISDHAHSPSCASVLLSRLVLFNRREHFGEEPPWRIFTTLMPIVIANLPLSVSFEDGRFSLAIDDAIGEVSADKLSPVLEAWAQRLLNRIGRYVLGEFELAIVDPLLKVATSEVRLPILQDLLSVRDTGAKVVSTKLLAKSWDILSPPERELLVNVLTDDRDDTRWLSASVLTTHQPPLTLVSILAKEPNALEQTTEEIERSLHSSLFNACVHMFVGWPQPLWWYATHHSGNPNWSRIIRDLASNPAHPLHAVAFYEVANYGEEDELAKLIEDLPQASLVDTFERLLDYKVSHVGDWRQKAWQCLLTRANNLQMLDDFIERINTVLDGILEHISDIELWLGKSDIALKVLRLLPNDYDAIKRAKKIRDMSLLIQENLAEKKAEHKAVFKKVLTELCDDEWGILNEKPPRIYGSWDDIGHILKNAGASQEVLNAIEAKRIEAIKRHQQVRDGFNGSPDYIELSGWVEQTLPDN